MADINGDNRNELTFLALLEYAAWRSLFELLLEQLLGDFLSHMGDFTVKNPPSKVLAGSSASLSAPRSLVMVAGVSAWGGFRHEISSDLAAFLLAAMRAFRPWLACLGLFGSPDVDLDACLGLETLIRGLG